MKSEIELLIEEAWANRNTNPQKGVQQLALADTLLQTAASDPTSAKKTDNQTYVRLSLRNIGLAFADLSDFANALDHLLEALSHYEEISDTDGIASVSNSIGIVYSKTKLNSTGTPNASPTATPKSAVFICGKLILKFLISVCLMALMIFGITLLSREHQERNFAFPNKRIGAAWLSVACRCEA